jgi:hypothetical protein
VKRIAAYLLAMVAVCLLAIGVLIAKNAHAQVTDRPVLTQPPANAVVDVQAAPLKLCIAWFERDADPYGDWHTVFALLDSTRLTAAQVAAAASAVAARDLGALAKMRTINVVKADVKACDDKLTAIVPPAVWIIAPDADGVRPAYCLDPVTKKRTKVCGTVQTTYQGRPMTCFATVRSIETTSSVYGTWPGAQVNEGDPVRVALCKRQ